MSACWHTQGVQCDNCRNLWGKEAVREGGFRHYEVSDAELWKELYRLKNRVEELEKLVKEKRNV